MRRFAIALTLLPFAFSQTSQTWVERSNLNTQLLIDVDAKYSPESASSTGVPGMDDRITTLTADRPQQIRADEVKVREELQKRLTAEKDPLVQQDLVILMTSLDRDIRAIDANELTFLPYSDVAASIFSGVKGLLDEQVAPARRPNALVRLRKYVGLETGYIPMTTLAEERFRDKLRIPGLLGPSKDEVEKNLNNTNTYITGIGVLLEKFGIKDYQEALMKLRQQLTEYDAFVRREVLPKARTDFRLPAAIYANRMEQYGVDYTPEDLKRVAHAGFTAIQAEMKPIAERVAKARHLTSSDYRNVIRELKKEQIPSDEIMPHYAKRLTQIEDIVRANKLVTLPARAAIIRLASAAETARQPAPHMVPPPLLNNKGERGQFVLPLGTKTETGESIQYDDFTFAAASWTLTAHEARPGHELQFASMVERGVSLARALYAFNSTNVEGWGLYAEWFMLPYMPDDGKLISLQFRLLRAARAFIDPALQAGELTKEQAMKILQEDVVCSKAFATEEVDRYMFRSPGQAVSYYDGFTRLLETRQAIQKKLGAKFDAQQFHDYIVSQGLLPPALLRKAVTEHFNAN